MLVTVTDFGSVWRRHFRKGANDVKQFARAAYFNTTGVPVNGRIRTRPKIVGHVRFNSVGGFNPNRPLAAVNGVFDCAEPCVWQGQNKILFKRLLPIPEQPDYFLVVVRSGNVGHIEVGLPAWRSEGTLLISFSEWRDQQEAMLLMPPDSWLQTEVGRFELRPFVSWPWSARLHLESVAEG
ncbi:MAG TPA: hypothetical protein VGU63_13210 [Candidatus Acidoferrales bacterium]|nr:hypothetical protein [Candidatus Acidoferrales bacterium]